MQHVDSEYPTDAQIEDSYKAYERGGEKGILKYLKGLRQKRNAEETKAAETTEGE